jgi:hypothetical protein
VVGTVTLEADPPLSIFSFQWDVNVPPSPPGGGGSGGKPVFSDFKVTKAVDAVAPKAISQNDYPESGCSDGVNENVPFG